MSTNTPREKRKEAMKTTSIYIAGASRELDRVRPRVEAVDASPHFRITLNWVPLIDSFGGDSVDTRPQADRAKNAMDDIKAVVDADVVWFLLPKEQTKGMWAELGSALTMNLLAREKKLIVASWESPELVPLIRPLFLEPVDMIYESDAEAVVFLDELAAQGFDLMMKNLGKRPTS